MKRPFLLAALWLAGCSAPPAISPEPVAPSPTIMIVTAAAAPTIVPTRTATPDLRPRFTQTPIPPTPLPEGSCYIHDRPLGQDLPLGLVEAGSLNWSGGLPDPDSETRVLWGLNYPIIDIDPSPDASHMVVTVFPGAWGQVSWRAMLLVDRRSGGLRWLHTDARYDQHIFEWLPSGNLIWVDSQGEVWQWDGEAETALLSPVPIGRIWLTTANTLFAQPCDYNEGLRRLDLASGVWERIEPDDPSVDQIVHGGLMRNDKSGMVALGPAGTGSNEREMYVWIIPAAMGQPAHFVRGSMVELIGTDAYFGPGQQIGNTPYWIHNLPLRDVPPLIDERDASFHTYEELGIALPPPPTYPVAEGQTLFAVFDEMALIKTPYRVLVLNTLTGQTTHELTLDGSGYRGISAAMPIPDGLLIGATKSGYPPSVDFVPTEICPCSLIEWIFEP